LQVQVVNFVQHRSQVTRTAHGLLTMTATPPPPVDPLEQTAERVESGEIGFVEYNYPAKWIARTGPKLEISWGNHYLTGAASPAESTSAIVCLHAPLRSKSVLHAKVDAHRPSEDLNDYRLTVGRRWRLCAMSRLRKFPWCDRGSRRVGARW
jgi:hypothetical protein